MRAKRRVWCVFICTLLCLEIISSCCLVYAGDYNQIGHTKYREYEEKEIERVLDKLVYATEGVSIDDKECAIINAIPVFSELGIEEYVGYNVKVNGQFLWLIIGKNNRVNLINEYNKGGLLPDDKIIYYLRDRGLYFIGDEITDEFGNEITDEKFAAEIKVFSNIRNNRNDEYYEALSEINGTLLLKNVDYNIRRDSPFYMGATHYNGTDSGASGYGGIINIIDYMTDRYGGNPSPSNSGISKSVNTQTMQSIS